MLRGVLGWWGIAERFSWASSCLMDVVCERDFCGDVRV